MSNYTTLQNIPGIWASEHPLLLTSRVGKMCCRSTICQRMTYPLSILSEPFKEKLYNQLMTINKRTTLRLNHPWTDDGCDIIIFHPIWKPARPRLRPFVDNVQRTFNDCNGRKPRSENREDSWRLRRKPVGWNKGHSETVCRECCAGVFEGVL